MACCWMYDHRTCWLSVMLRLSESDVADHHRTPLLTGSCTIETGQLARDRREIEFSHDIRCIATFGTIARCAMVKM